jgi:nitroimidazol reductase NimA-like FMN-containing flavoprotein (pyridoxamine 5'-phosphate oxidase superfamily)
MTSNWQRAETLQPAECWSLLRSVRMGRVGLWDAQGPQVLPVNHSVVEQTVVFRTDLYGSLAEGTRGTEVAFEADELDDRLDSGWSVLVVGRVAHVEDPEEMADLFGRLGEPWAPGGRPLVARIVPTRVTGRRFHRR